MKKLLFIGLSLMLCTISYGQTKDTKFDTYHKNVYVEFLGSHINVGMNYDMRLKKGKNDGIGFRVGVGGFSTTVQDQQTTISLGLVTLPLELNHVVGKGRSSFITGFGLLPVYATLNAEGELTNYKYIEDNGFGLIGGFLTMGYRVQPKKTGLMFQLNWNPMILKNSGFNVGWVGIGIGMGFK